MVTIKLGKMGAWGELMGLDLIDLWPIENN